MVVVRYVALVALVIWVGGMATVLVAADPARDLMATLQPIAYACGAAILVSFLLMKFVGPPPHAFFPRFGLAALMLAVTIYAAYTDTERLGAAASVAVGLVLLTWYVRE